MDPVDEFAQLKQAIRLLEARADLLREGFLQPDARRRNNRYEVVIRQQTRRVFKKERLPTAILNDPVFWAESTSAIVTVRDFSKDAPDPPAARASRQTAWASPY